VAVMAAAVVAGCSSTEKAQETPETQPPQQTDGPSLNGTYRLEFDAKQRTALGQPSPQEQNSSRNWAFRSHCGDAGCVATATRLNNDGSASDVQAELDFIDGKWVMVLGEDSKCNQGGQPARVLGTWELEPQPDGTLTGMWTEITTGSDCPWVLQMPMKATREGDVAEGVEVTDPSTLPPRRPSRPEGFHGSYTQTVTFDPPWRGEPADLTIDVKSYCVRNTDECAATQAVIKDGAVSQITPLTFAGDRWTFRYPRPERTCPDGQPMQSILNDEVLLPDPPTNPMTELTGTRRIEILEPCPGEELLTLDYRLNVPPPPPEGAPAPPPEGAAAPPAEPAPAEPTPTG